MAGTESKPGSANGSQHVNGIAVDGSSSDVADTDIDEDRRLNILYASQTGSAQDVAEFIGREAWRRHFKARVQNIRDFDKAELFDAPPTIIVTSTTGQGAFPAAILPLWNWLIRGDLPEELLENFNYALFGLGDSSYARYNWPVRKLQRRLEMLGAMELIERGEADDQHYLGIEGTLQPWLDTLWSTLLLHFPIPPGCSLRPQSARPPSRVRLRWSKDDQRPSQTPLGKPEDMHQAKVIRNDRVTATDHFQDTRHFSLEFDTEQHYTAGDIAEIRPENLPDNVDQFLNFLQWSDRADSIIELIPQDSDIPLPAHWPKSTSLRELCIKYLDIFSVPRKSFFQWLAYFTTSELETEKLIEFISPDGQDDLYSYSTRPRRTIFEVLTEFKSAKIPFDYILDIFPEIQPRQFSIASSVTANPRQLDLLFAVVRYKTILKAPRTGVATAWMSTLKPGDQVSIRITNGDMRLNRDPSQPVMFIGPGTGIAPFRAMVQEQLARKPNGGDITVFFGCRSSSKDFYFRDEWMELEAKKKVKFVLAASRDQQDKIYVQHRIEEHAETVWQCVSRTGGSIYISGSAGQMPKSVRKAIKAVCCKHGQMDEEAAEAYIESMAQEGRYVEETWA